MNNLTKQFLDKYDKDNNLKFSDLQYRKGARITCSFGLAEGFRKVNNKMIWDSTRIHTGTDRSYHNKSGLNIVIAPFDFQRAEYKDYGKDNVYGSVTRLFNDVYKFEMRIMHIYPNELNKDFKHLLDNKLMIPRNTVIGKAGEYGSSSSGKHTHTEIVSYNKSNLVFDEILKMKYQEEASLPYTNDEILNFYRKQPFWKNERRASVILDDFQKQMKKRKIENKQINEFSFCYFDWFNQSLCTRYGSAMIFNGL